MQDFHRLVLYYFLPYFYYSNVKPNFNHPMPPTNGGRHRACDEPCRFDYAAGRKQRREAIDAPESEGALAERE